MLNKVFLIGNLTNDPELRETPSGVSVCRFDLAVSRPYTQDGERITDFFECSAWRGTAEAIAKHCKKGHKLHIEGSVQTRTYEDNNGSKRKVFDINVKEVEFLTPRANVDAFDEVPTRPAKNKPSLQAMDGDSDIPF